MLVKMPEPKRCLIYRMFRCSTPRLKLIKISCSMIGGFYAVKPANKDTAILLVRVDFDTKVAEPCQIFTSSVTLTCKYDFEHASASSTENSVVLRSGIRIQYKINQARVITELQTLINYSYWAPICGSHSTPCRVRPLVSHIWTKHRFAWIGICSGHWEIPMVLFWWAIDEVLGHLWIQVYFQCGVHL